MLRMLTSEQKDVKSDLQTMDRAYPVLECKESLGVNNIVVVTWADLPRKMENTSEWN